VACFDLQLYFSLFLYFKRIFFQFFLFLDIKIKFKKIKKYYFIYFLKKTV